MHLRSKESYITDNRIILTLDAGGTNFVFSALKGGQEIIDSITLSSVPNDLKQCLDQIKSGFLEVMKQIDSEVYAISFAFPGPANYTLGIIEDLPNLPAFRGGVALGPFLEEIFQIPVYINNDGNLFALGEYIFGFLPWVNQTIKENNGVSEYKNLLGLTLGSGFGGGIVCDGQLILGDNSNGGEIWLMRNKVFKEYCTDASIGKDKIRYLYADLTKLDYETVPEPDILYKIAKGQVEGSQESARKAFHIMGQVLGDAIANSVTLIDGLVVMSGGICGASEFFMPAVMEELNGTIYHLNKTIFPRMAVKAYYLEEKESLLKFIRGEMQTLQIPFSDNSIVYDSLARIGIGLSKLGVSKSIALGAYVYALSQ